MRALILATALTIGAAPPSYRADLDKYRHDRVTELTAPDGWLAVRGLFWLHEGENTAGSDSSNDITLPGRTAKRIGVFHVRQRDVSFDADAAAVVTDGIGHRINATSFTREESTIETSGVTISVIRRGDKTGLRMWDPESPHRTQFQGLKYFPLDSAYHVHAKFVPYDKLKPVQVPNVLGQLVTMQSPGVVEFKIKDQTYRLEPVYETPKHEDLFFIFKDLTSRTETYEAGRFLHTPLPKAGVVDLDFNRAYNPPCAFTEFATCPLPIKENQLPIRIPAGELRYHVSDR
ncbi:MAG TPA: DUF1684 domain-containing protein [Vicinamibacterales bacterium]|jgi:hypothetical protein|nr:DUF1684 domain-containing protein [Vicinamibacterales bacterium]